MSDQLDLCLADDEMGGNLWTCDERVNYVIPGHFSLSEKCEALHHKALACKYSENAETLSAFQGGAKTQG